MSARIIHSEEGYMLQVDHPLGDSFPARENSNAARGDYYDFLMAGEESDNFEVKKNAGYMAYLLEVVEA